MRNVPQPAASPARTSRTALPRVVELFERASPRASRRSRGGGKVSIEETDEAVPVVVTDA